MPQIFKPRKYQGRAIRFSFFRPFSGLFIDPGLGKTGIFLAVVKLCLLNKKNKGFLIVGPINVIHTVWPEEIKKWAAFNGLTVSILHGPDKLQNLRKKADIYLINPEGLEWLFRVGLFRKPKKNWPFDGLIIDESSKFKNPSSKRFRILKKVRPAFNRVHIGTGSPAPNGLVDVWSQVYLLDEGASLGDKFGGFKTRYFEKGGYKEKQLFIRPGSSDSIKKRIAPAVLQMRDCDYLDLPPIVDHDISVMLPPKAQKFYDALEQEHFSEWDGEDFYADSSPAKNMKLRQVASGALYLDQDLDEARLSAFKRPHRVIHKAKIEALKDLLDELAGKPLLLAYLFGHDLKEIRKALGDVPYIGSGVKGNEVVKIRNNWNAGKYPLLLGQPASMGHGLNLQESTNHVGFFTLDHNLENYEQFIRRVRRSGVVGDSVINHRFIASNTVEELVAANIATKDAEQSDFKAALHEYRIRKFGV